MADPVIRTRNTVYEAKLEPIEGEDALPTAADAIKLTGFDLTVDPTVEDVSEFQGGLGAGEHTVASVRKTHSPAVKLRGAGGEPGTAPPQIRPLLLSAGFVEDVLDTGAAALAPSSVSADGKVLTFATPPAGWPTDLRELVGRAVLVVAGAAPPVADLIVEAQLNGAALEVRLGGEYAPALTTTATLELVPQTAYVLGNPVPFPTVSSYAFLDGLLDKVLGGRSDMNMTWTSGGAGVATFPINGKDGGRLDAPVPDVTTVTPQAPTWKDGLLAVDQDRLCAQQLTLALNNAGTNIDCPNAEDGFDGYVTTGRQVQGTLNPYMTLPSTRDALKDLKDNDVFPIAAILGSRNHLDDPPENEEGNHVGLTVPHAKLRGLGMGDRNNLRDETLTWQSADSNGEVILTFF